MVITILWVFPFLGFGTPIALMGGFIFGKWVGTLVVVLGLTIGATFLYLFGNFFLKELIREKFLNKFENLESKFKKTLSDRSALKAYETLKIKYKKYN